MKITVEVSVERIALARALRASDLRALRAAVVAAVDTNVARTSGARPLSAQTLAGIGEAVGAAIATKCS